MIRLIAAFVIGFTLMWGIMGTWQVAHGQSLQFNPGPPEATAGECPANKPNKRKVTTYPTLLTCTLVACMPKLVCGKSSDRCVYMPVDCNSCTPEPRDIEICLSQEELDNSRR